MPSVVKFVLDDGSEIDAEVDDEVYKHLQSGIPFLGEKYRRDVQRSVYLDRRIDKSSFEYKSPYQITSRNPYTLGKKVEPLSEERDPETKRKRYLASSGITVGAGPFNKGEISYFQSLAKDSPHEFAEFFIPKVKDKIAPSEDVNPRDLVKVGEDGKVRFLDLQTDANPAGTNRWTEFEGLGIDPFNALELGMDIAGSFGGAKYAATRAFKPFKEALATAAGGAAGASEAELARLLIGKAHGITGPISDDPNAGVLAEAGATLGATGPRAALSAGGSLIGSGVGRAYYNFTSTPNPYFFNQDTARNIEQSLSQGGKIVEDVRAIPGGEKFSPDAAIVSGEESLLSLRATLLANASGKTELALMGKLTEQDQTNSRILNNILKSLLQGRKVTAEEAGLALKGHNLEEILRMAPEKQKAKLLDLFRQNKADQRALGPIAEVAEAGRASIVSRIRGTQRATEGKITTQEATGLEKVVQDLRDQEAVAWGKYESVAQTVERNTGKSLKIKIDGNESPELNLLPKLSQFARMADELWSEPAKRRFSSVLAPLEDAATRNNGEVTLREVNTNLSQMKETLRIARKETAQDSPSVALLETAIKSLQEVRDNYINNVLRNPVLGDTLLAAEASTRKVHDLTKRSVASKLLAKDAQGVYKIRNPDAVFQDVMVPGADDGMRQWMDIVGDDPGLVQATKDYLGQHYHASVIRNGLADPKAHQAWMRDYGSSAKMVFGEDFGAIRRLGGIGKAIQDSQQKLTRLEQALKFSSRGKLSRMDPEKIVDSVLGIHSKAGGASSKAALNLTETVQVVETLKRGSPETFQLVQDRAKEMIRNSLFGDTATARTSSKLDSKTLGKFLEEGQEARLTLLFGDQYVNNLRTVKQGLELMERQAKATPVRMETPVLTIFRAIFGPLSRTQRFITAGRRWNIVGQEQKLAEIISDPAKLRKVMRVANMPARSPFAMATLFQVGFLEAADMQAAQ